MRSQVLAAIVLAASLSAAGAEASGARPRDLPASVTSPLDQDTLSALEEAQAELNLKDYAAAYKVLDRLTRNARFDDNPPALRRAIWVLMAGCAGETRDWPAARAAIDKATAFADAGGDEWYTHHLIASESGDKAGAVRGLGVIARRFPAELGRFTDNAIQQWLYEAIRLPGGEDAAFELADALVSGWTPRDPFASLDGLRRIQIEGLLKRARDDDALASARRLDGAATLIGMRADKRYDALTRTHPELFDVKAANLARLPSVDAMLKTHPKRLSGQIARVNALLNLNRADEALATADAAIARARADAKAFDDTDEQLSWTLYAQQKALTALGRGEEALEALEIASRVPEHGAANVSQTLNLAVVRLKAGRTRSALTTAQSVSAAESSPYGRSVSLWVVACAQHLLGDRKASDAAVEGLRDLGADGVANLYVALRCRGDQDAAAVLLIDRLRDPTRRYETLLTLQIMPPDRHQTPFDQRLDDQEAQLRDRPDVRAAIDAVGRINTYRPEDLGYETRLAGR